MIIQGGMGEAGATEQLADELARDNQVISYDRRGLSRSTDGGAVPITMARHADDAALVLSAATTQPARVIGASIGALIGLHLAVRHTDRVSMLVAHEPPMASLVLDHEREAELDKVAAAATVDVRAAIGHMASLTGGGQDSVQEGARSGPLVGDIDENLRWFFAQDFPAVRRSALSADEIVAAANTTTVIATGGVESRGGWEYRCAQKLARRLDHDLVEMPGGHNSLVSHPWALAVELKRLFMETGPDER
nr:alpha/beta fold hydrolase [Nocardiopsis mwathae]